MPAWNCSPGSISVQLVLLPLQLLLLLLVCLEVLELLINNLGFLLRAAQLPLLRRGSCLGLFFLRWGVLALTCQCIHLSCGRHVQNVSFIFAHDLLLVCLVLKLNASLTRSRPSWSLRLEILRSSSRVLVPNFVLKGLVLGVGYHLTHEVKTSLASASAQASPCVCILGLACVWLWAFGAPMSYRVGSLQNCRLGLDVILFRLLGRFGSPTDLKITIRRKSILLLK